MLTATKECSFDCAHRLSFHKGKCFNLHGHTYKMQVTFYDSCLINGMVKDFYDIKQIMNDIVEEWDHSTVLYERDKINVDLALLLKKNGMKVIELPFEPTVENMCNHFLDYFQRKDLKVYKIRLYETPTSFAEVTK